MNRDIQAYCKDKLRQQKAKAIFTKYALKFSQNSSLKQLKCSNLYCRRTMYCFYKSIIFFTSAAVFCTGATSNIRWSLKWQTIVKLSAAFATCECATLKYLFGTFKTERHCKYAPSCKISLEVLECDQMCSLQF